jgi:hypothetical protein
VNRWDLTGPAKYLAGLLLLIISFIALVTIAICCDNNIKPNKSMYNNKEIIILE